MQDETIFIIFAELARFDKALEECADDLERMLYVLKNGWRLQDRPPEFRKEMFARIFRACEIAEFDEQKRIQYDQEMYDERRRNGELAAAKRIGREEACLENALKFKQLGVPVDIISKATGLPVETIEGLKSLMTD